MHSSLREESFGDRFAFTCNGCKEMGYGSCYTCTNKCNYHLHTACQNAPPVMCHPFFGQGQFVLDKSMLPPYNHQGLANLCVACGTIVQGWRYVLAINGGYTIFLHPCCITLPHPTLYAKLENVNCVHCQSSRVGNEGAQGWAYVKNGFAVHVKCMKDMLHKDWERKYYSCPPNYDGHANYNYGTQEGGLNSRVNQDGVRGRYGNGLQVLAQIFSIFDSLGLV
ncbi:hypothetical protein BVRB_6g151230 [Beta vulgaris subsp. vulgaris]|nr:hypothetical protein BVRB_6g151230 [Beta vulgaris subsp. vulgaris]